MSDSVEALGVIEKRQKLESETEEDTSHEDMDCGTNAAEAANVLYPPRRCDVALLTAASLGQVEEVKRIMDEEDGDPCFQDFNTGMSVLMAAAGAGHADTVQLLLEEGAPWNAVDREHRCAGDYAVRNGHQHVIDLLMQHACTCELLLGCVVKNERKEHPTNPTYLASSLTYSEDRLVEDEAKLAVMMEWERPLMARHADFIAGPAPVGSVLNVGFGMGIVDTALQSHRPAQHTIIEAHPQVLKKMHEDGWASKEGVRVLEGRWQDVVPKLAEEGAQFDGIFFDTYAEDDLDLNAFHEFLPKLMKVGGRYSFYNGQCPDNVFFHGVACEVLRLQMKSRGFSCEYEPIKVDEVAKDELWKGLKRRYWYFDTYYLPKCVRLPT